MAEPAQKLPAEAESGEDGKLISETTVEQNVRTKTIYSAGQAANDNNNASAAGSAGTQATNDNAAGSDAGNSNGQSTNVSGDNKGASGVQNGNGQKDNGQERAQEGENRGEAKAGEASGDDGVGEDKKKDKEGEKGKEKDEEGKKKEEGEKEGEEGEKNENKDQDKNKDANEGGEAGQGKENNQQQQGTPDAKQAGDEGNPGNANQENVAAPNQNVAGAVNTPTQAAAPQQQRTSERTPAPATQQNRSQGTPARVQPTRQRPQVAAAQPGSPARPNAAPANGNDRRAKNAGYSNRAADSNKRPRERLTTDKKPTESPVAKSQEGGSNKSKVPSGGASTKTSQGNKGSPTSGANLKQQAVQKTIGKAVDVAGKKLGLSGVQNQFIANLIALIVELISGVGILIFIFHVVGLIVWVFRKERWKEVRALLIPFILIAGGGMLMAFLTVVMGLSVLTCSIGQSRIPFGIPMGVVSRIGAVMHSDVGYFAQLCDKLNVVTGGVGGTGSASSGTTGATAASGQNSAGATLADSETITEEVLIANTLLTRPAALPSTFATQTNRAGYVSPAQCQLSELPYSNETSLQRVAMPDGTTTIITLPIHQTIDCSKIDPARVDVRSIHAGKIIRLVYDDPTLGDYATIEYPNNLRVSYYHIALLPELTLGKTVAAAEKIGTLAQTGGHTFEGVTMRFEYKLANGAWQVFNPISANPELSILTTFPCSNDASKSCLIL